MRGGRKVTRREAAGPAPAALGRGEGERTERRSSKIEGREGEKDGTKTHYGSCKSAVSAGLCISSAV